MVRNNVVFDARTETVNFIDNGNGARETEWKLVPARKRTIPIFSERERKTRSLLGRGHSRDSLA